MRDARRDRTVSPWEKRFFCLVPRPGVPASAEPAELLVRLRDELARRGLRPEHVLKLAFFVRASDPAELARRSRSVEAGLQAVLHRRRPAVSVIPQPPERGRGTALEALALARPSNDVEVLAKRYRGLPYVVVRAAGGREVLAGGISGRGAGGLRTRIESAFRTASGLLAGEGMDLTDIVRQWNYIEDLLAVRPAGRGFEQNYQIFNDIRTKAYAGAGFERGFPAATGIGMSTGGFLLELVAASGTAAEVSLPVRNPGQVDAHRYSGEVLVGERPPGGSPKSTPKFERARAVLAGGSGLCYVSGTAAISGQDVVAEGDVVGQTWATVRNIRRLVGVRNLRASGLRVRSVASTFSCVRAYVKRPRDIPAVRRICAEAFPGAPFLALAADVCRDRLLVEIEGAVEFREE